MWEKLKETLTEVIPCMFGVRALSADWKQLRQKVRIYTGNLWVPHKGNIHGQPTHAHASFPSRCYGVRRSCMTMSFAGLQTQKYERTWSAALFDNSFIYVEITVNSWSALDSINNAISSSRALIDILNHCASLFSKVWLKLAVAFINEDNFHRKSVGET